ncbi:MAG: VOC family protein [Nitrospira sp.]|nr:VOC family protein [Nitrospira sp.]
MTIELNHTIVPARDKKTSARFFAHIFGVPYEPSGEFFAPVRVNDRLTLDFDDDYSPDERFDVHHYAFHVSEDEFDAIFARVQEAGLAYGSEPGNPGNGTLNGWNGGRGVYFRDPGGHLLELLTRP